LRISEFEIEKGLVIVGEEERNRKRYPVKERLKGGEKEEWTGGLIVILTGVRLKYPYLIVKSHLTIVI
jgi:hypothetical protein